MAIDLQLRDKLYNLADLILANGLVTTVSGTVDANVTNTVDVNVTNTPIAVTLDEPIDVNANITNTSIDVNIVGGGGTGGTVEAGASFKDVIYPLATDGDSIYIKDIDLTFSSAFGFNDPDVSKLFDAINATDTVNNDVTNPKQIIIALKRIHNLSNIVFYSNNIFSNVKITISNAGVLTVVYDDSLNNSGLTFLDAKFSQIVNGIITSVFATQSIIIEFFTNDVVSLNYLHIPKILSSRTFIQGQTPDGNFVDFQASRKGNFKVALEEYQGDAFGRLRVSEPYTQFDNSLTSSVNDTLFWSTLTNGTASGAYTNSTSSYLLSVVNNGDYIVRQTKQRFKYQPGKSSLFLITGLLNTSTNVRKRLGYVDYDNVGLVTITNVPQNGIFFENTNGTLSWNIVNNGVVTESVTQSNWNIDKCDGTGNSLFVLDVNSTNIFQGDMEWLGVGAVRVGFVTDSGAFVVCHIFKHASKGFTDVYMRTANLAIAYECTSLGGSGSTKQICSSVISEGGFNPKGIFRGIFNVAAANIAANNTETVIGFRLKEDAFEYSVEVNSVSVLAAANGQGRWFLCFNPVYSGTAVFTDLISSNIQESSSNLIVNNLGLVITGGTFSTEASAVSSTIQTALRVGKSLLGVRDEMWLIIRTVGNTENYYGTLEIKELL